MSNRDFFRVLLPWVNWDISPNGTSNRRYKTALTREHRQSARLLAMNAIGYQNWIDKTDSVFSVWIFRQPNKRKRDTGNMRAACKAYQDGVFDALLVDDSVIKPEALFQGEIVEGGEIELRLYEDCMQWLDDIIALAKEYHKADER